MKIKSKHLLARRNEKKEGQWLYLIDTGEEVILVDTGLPAGTPEEVPDENSVAFEDLPDDWKCERCKQPKDHIKQIKQIKQTGAGK